MAALPTSTFSARYLERAISTLAWRGTTRPFVYLCYTSLVGDGHHQKYECDINFFVCLLVHRYRIDALRWSASHHIAVQELVSAMRNESSGKYTPRPPHCPSCAQLMPLARTTSRFGNLPDLYIFECRACGVSHIDEANCSEYRQAAISVSSPISLIANTVLVDTVLVDHS